ncbi:hypothetical protein FB45DRAFT_738787 [Roridomyces roridus]|uniref:F-box domain-containing protein n=1 Tax=Roridomyces roridus TaxID=1738132 RepID=A0AAD7C957_9AGAR|nr:hypothetical protein FB45DRAFT_738787 [Roridomyces roridus]
MVLERNALHQVLIDYKYPVLSLPSEITSQIFVQFLPSYPERTSFIGLSSPALLLQVCRQWRDVALATPELWSTFEVKMRYRDTPAVHARNQRLLVEWLERSKDCPLSVELFCWSGSSVALVEAALIDALVRHSKRWQDMRLSLPYKHLHRMAGSFPILRDLHLGAQGAWSSDGTKLSPPPNFTLQTPNLRKLHLDHPGDDFDTFKNAFSWSQITVFIGYLYERDAAQVLLSAPALEECSMIVDLAKDSEGGRRISKKVSPPIIPPLHHLKSLALTPSGSPGRNGAVLLKALATALPVLAIFDVDESLLGSEDPVATLSLLCPPCYTGRVKVRDARTTAVVYELALPNVEELVVEQWVRHLIGCLCCDDSLEDDSDSE